MRSSRPPHARGLLAGLLALVAFASSAVAMTAGAPDAAEQAAQQRTVVTSEDGDRHGGGFEDDDRGRGFGVRGDGDRR